MMRRRKYLFQTTIADGVDGRDKRGWKRRVKSLVLVLLQPSQRDSDDNFVKFVNLSIFDVNSNLFLHTLFICDAIDDSIEGNICLVPRGLGNAL